MAVFSTNLSHSPRSPRPGLLERFDALFNAIAKARTCAHEVEQLSSLSDAQLAERGLSRKTIVRHAARAYL